MQIIEQARWIKDGDWYEARDPQENRLMFRFNPKQMIVEWGYRRRMVIADLCKLTDCSHIQEVEKW